MKLIATKNLTYNTRRLKAGDVFDADKPNDARILIAIKKAKQAPVDDIKALRDEYEGLYGKKPYYGWDAEKLAEKIADAAT